MNIPPFSRVQFFLLPVSKFRLSGFLFLFFTAGPGNFFTAAAQCPGSGITLTSQSQVNTFSSTYPGCTVMPVSITITGDDIQNLNGLSVLTGFENTASLTLEDNPILTSLTGLSGITAIPGALKIINNDALTNLNGLGGVTSIGFNLQVDGNAVLTSLGALANVTTIGGYLDVEFNPVLTSFGGGLNNLTSVGQFLQINNNATLSTLNGLNSLASVGQYLFISSNSALTSVNGLSSLTSVGGDFEISGHPSMTTLGGLNNLSTVNGKFSLIQNTALTNLNQLANITNISGDLTISFNTLLSNCAAQGICDYIDSPNGAIAINNNTGNCATLIAVQTACGLLPVELLEFNAVIRDNSVRLVWSTASEKDNLGYELERSADGDYWSPIGFVPGEGTTSHRMDYFFVDEKPLQGINYYRLKQMDIDGKSQYSPIVVADLRSNNQPFEVFPNPSMNGLVTMKIVSAEEGDANLEVYDRTGVRVYNKNVQLPEGAIVFPVSTTTLPKGAYTVRLEMPGGQALFRKLIIQ